MKEYIVDFELHKDGVVIKWMQNTFQLTREGPDDTETAFDHFHKYARNHWKTEDTDLNTRIVNIWMVDVE